MQTITNDEYYNALCRYMLAVRKQKEVVKLQEEIGKFLKRDDMMSQVDDYIYDDSNEGSQSEFDMALSSMDIVVGE